MKRAMVIAAIYIFVASATAGATAYEMVMNNDKILCPAMLKLVNEDIKRHNEIRYESHQEFAAIKWESMESMGEKFKDDFCRIHKMAKFDVNNDGREDRVVKISGCIKSQLTDSLYIFNGDDPTFSSFTEPADITTKYVGSFMSSKVSRNYRLRQLPPREEMFGTKIYEGVGGWMILNPFLYQGSFYLAVTDLNGYGFIVGKYRDTEQLDDVCYFRAKETKDEKVKPKKEGQR